MSKEKPYERLTNNEYKECIALLNAWFEDPEYANQGHFARARWAIKRLGLSLGLDNHECDIKRHC